MLHTISCFQMVGEITSMTPLVSILIPAHNAEQWLSDTLRSAIAQTWERKEIIVVDDGSRDRTFEIASQFESQSVSVVRQEKQGAAAARNTALSLSHGDYIQWLDADDLLAPDKISRQMEARKEGASNWTLLSGPWGTFIYRPQRARFTPTSLWADLSPVEWLLHKLQDNVFMQTATWLVSRDLTAAAGLWDTRMLYDDDGEYFCRVLLASDGVHFVPDAKVYYRNSGSISLGFIGDNPSKIEALWLSMKLHIGYLRSLEDSPRVRAACLQYLRTSLFYFYPQRNSIIEEAEQMAEEWGEQLGQPHRNWKYAWTERIIGQRLAKYGQRFLRGTRMWLERKWDRTLLEIEGRNSSSLV
jgi:glycosyltransferase involved in cell wall biosynthesis